MRMRLPPGATPGRLGGEEFAIWLDHATLDDARRIAEGLRHHLAVLDPGHGEAVTASFGVVGPRPGEDLRGLMARADGLLYDAKRAGRNRVAG